MNELEVGILNMSANPDHPFHVAVGNNKAPQDMAQGRLLSVHAEGPTGGSEGEGH